MTVAPARLRWLAWLALLAVAMLGGWLWFGNAGAALMGLWLQLARPAREIHLDFPQPVRWVRLSRFALTCGGGSGLLHRRVLRLYRDEVNPETFARLRRQLKEACRGPSI